MPTTEQQTQQQLLQQTAPTTAGDALTQQTTLDQAGLVGPQLGQTEAYNNALGGYSTAQYGVTQEQNALSQQENSLQSGTNAAQQGFEEQGYGLQQAAFGLTAQQQAQANTQALQGISSSGVANGTLNTIGQGRNVSNQNSAYALQQQQLANSQQQSQASQGSEEAGFAGGQQQLQLAGQNLGLIAQANGISQNQALTMLNYGNQQAGATAQSDILGLLGTYGAAGGQDEQQVGSALSNIGFAGGVNTLARPGG